VTEGVVIALIAASQAVVVALVGVVASRIGKVTHELQPNSGKSMRDAVDRIERRQRSSEDWQESADQKLDRDNLRIGSLEHRVSEHIEQSATIVSLLAKKERT